MLVEPGAPTDSLCSVFPYCCLQCVLGVLSPALEENLRQQGQERSCTKLQCLKCQQEFAQPPAPRQQGLCPMEGRDYVGTEAPTQVDQGTGPSLG